MDPNPQSRQNEDAAFNMAIATLERLDIILQQIRTTDSSIQIAPIFRHKMKIKLLKQFFINAAPLMDVKIVAKYKDEILGLKTSMKIGVKNGSHTRRESFSEKEATRVDEILIELQQNLRKYFMPSKKHSMF